MPHGSKINLNEKTRGEADYQLKNSEEFVLEKMNINNLFSSYSSDGILMDQIEFNRVVDHIIKPLVDISNHYKEQVSLMSHINEENENYIADLERVIKEIKQSYIPYQ